MPPPASSTGRLRLSARRQTLHCVDKEDPALGCRRVIDIHRLCAMENLDAAEEWLDSWVAGVDAQASRTVELSRRVAALTGNARSRDGSIIVTVGSSGALESLGLDDQALQTTGADLSRHITTLIRQAQAHLAAQVTEQVRQTVGLDTETGQAVLHSFTTRFPAPPDDDRPDPRAW